MELHRLDTTREDVTRTRESPDEAGEVEEELLKQGTELEDDHRTREHPDKAKEERPKVGAPGWVVTAGTRSSTSCGARYSASCLVRSRQQLPTPAPTNRCANPYGTIDL